MSDLGFVLGHKWRDVFEWADRIEFAAGVRRRDFKAHKTDKRCNEIIQLVGREHREPEVDKLLGEFCRLHSQRVDAAVEERSAKSFRDAGAVVAYPQAAAS